MPRVTELRARGVDLATTTRNVDELFNILLNKFGHDVESASVEVSRVIEPVQVVGVDEFEHFRRAASERLRAGGKSDWPTLAAALALEGEIWSEDVDFFGVGVPVWSTANVKFFGGSDARNL